MNKGKINGKTTTDLWLEEYLKQEGITFEHEPYGNNSGKNPDYLLHISGKKILVENKEIERIFLDNATNRVQTSDPVIHWRLLRYRIDKAARQLKPYKDEVDYCIVLLGKTKGFPIDLKDLFFAMYGNPVIKVPLDLKKGRAIEKPYLDMTMTGSLRRNHPETKQFLAQHGYISAVGLVKAFNGLRYYESQVMHKYMEEYYESNKDKEDVLEGAFRHYEKMWKKESKKIPLLYKDPDSVFYKIEVIANPLGNTMIDKNIFTGRWDIVQFPTVVSA